MSYVTYNLPYHHSTYLHVLAIEIDLSKASGSFASVEAEGRPTCLLWSQLLSRDLQ